MGVLCPIVHILVLPDLVNEKPECDRAENALPHGLGNIVPHLCIDSVELLHAAHVARGGWCVGEGPDAEVVHVLQCRVIVFEGDLDTWSEPDGVIDVLTVVVGHLQAVHESLRS